MHPLTKEFLDNVPLLDTEKVLPGAIYTSFGHPLFANWARVVRVHDLLADEESRELFRRSVVFRLLDGFLPEGRVMELYPLIAPETWAAVMEEVKAVPALEGDTPVDRAEIWLLKAYDHPACHVEPGDVVLDVGAFTGNSGAYFADQATAGGAPGKVYSFEPHPDTFAALQRNLAGRPELVCVHSGCSDKDGEALLRGDGVGAVLSTEGIPVPVCTIDSFVAAQGLDRVDFIKIDIEGREPEALTGAKETIRRFHPKLAVCIYHRSEHFYSLLEQICSCGRPYTFYLKNCEPTRWGAVLFCVPADEMTLPPLPANDSEADMMKHLGELFLMQTKVPEPVEVHVPVPVPQPVFRELSTWECGVQLAKNFHLYGLLRPLYRALTKKQDGTSS